MSTKIKNKATGDWEYVAKVRPRSTSIEILKSSASYPIRANFNVHGKMADVSVYCVSVPLNQGWNDIARIKGIKPVTNYQMLNCVKGNSIDDCLCFARADGNDTLISMYFTVPPTGGEHSTIINGCFLFE